MVNPFLLQIRRNKDESITLAALRDALLARLMSGEIRVKDAEYIVEETA